MCGIVGFVGSDNAEKNLVDSLKKLEYRGYDSAGIAVSSGDDIIITRAEGKIKNLEEKVVKSDNVTCGIGHTRWATHGKATETNAHPHLSHNGEWAIVHNGIIENFGTLKKEITKKGINFASETDTEVISQLLGLSKEKGIKALMDVCKHLVGSWGLACINKNEKGTVYLARNKSPLFTCIAKGNCYVASDPICFSALKCEYYMMEDNEFCVAKNGILTFFNESGNEITKKSSMLEDIIESNLDFEWNHYMIKEIHEIPEALKRVATTFSDGLPLFNLKAKQLKKVNRIRIVACGTAYHSGLVGATYLEKDLGIESTAHIASEFRYKNPIMDKKSLTIFVSQSGETADTLSALELAKKKGSYTIAITNVPYSTIAKKADLVLPICAGPEIAVASTKAYVCQLAVMYILSKYCKATIKGKPFNGTKQIFNVANNIYIPTDTELDDASNFVMNAQSMFFLGRNLDYYTAQEGCLKLKEITYINANAYAAGELKHGVLALVEDGTPLVVVATEKKLLEKTLNGANEAAARGGKIVLVSQFDIEPEKMHGFVTQIKLPELGEDFMPMIAVVPLQKLAYQVCCKKGFNPDQPRNLAKSVTVE